LIGFTIENGSAKTRMSIATNIMTFYITIGLGFLSHLQHLRSVRPSSILIIWLSLTLIFDIARCRTLWAVESGESVAIVLTTSVVLKACLLIVETIEKRKILLPDYRHLPPELLASEFNQWLAWWQTPLLFKGFKGSLSLDVLDDIDMKLGPGESNDTLYQRWRFCEFLSLLDSILDHQADI
jgi:ATP-binding cassette, subfamily C (CFTR/MRP), member 1